MDDMPTIVIDLSPRAMLKRKWAYFMREFDRVPLWIMRDQGFLMDDDPFRKACTKNHLFVNAKSRFCHICGEAR